METIPLPVSEQPAVVNAATVVLFIEISAHGFEGLAETNPSFFSPQIIVLGDVDEWTDIWGLSDTCVGGRDSAIPAEVDFSSELARKDEFASGCPTCCSWT